MNIFKETVYQDYLVKVFVATLLVASALNAFGNIALSIVTSIALGSTIPALIWKNQLQSKYLKDYPMYLKLIASLSASIVASQWGWVAMLV